MSDSASFIAVDWTPILRAFFVWFRRMWHQATNATDQCHVEAGARRNSSWLLAYLLDDVTPNYPFTMQVGLAVGPVARVRVPAFVRKI